MLIAASGAPPIRASTPAHPAQTASIAVPPPSIPDSASVFPVCIPYPCRSPSSLSAVFSRTASSARASRASGACVQNSQIVSTLSAP